MGLLGVGTPWGVGLWQGVVMSQTSSGEDASQVAAVHCMRTRAHLWAMVELVIVSLLLA